MKALLLTKPRKLEWVDFPDPVPEEDEVLVRIAACGICGSDIHGWDGSSGRRIPPLIMGHEAAGEIVAKGSKVTDWNTGDLVTFDSTIYCGDCEYCRSGAVNLCDNRRVVGVSPGDYRQHGAFAEMIALPERILYRIPEGMSPVSAAMTEPVSIALHAVSLANPGSNDRAVVVGSGMIGLFVIQALRCAGVKQIIAVDLDSDRLDLARQLGATDIVQAGEPDTLDLVRDLSGGEGVDISFEVVGITPAMDLAIKALRKSGTCVVVGNISPKVDFPLQELVTRELKVLGSCSSAGEYPRSLQLIANEDIIVNPMISRVVPLVEGPDWFERLSGPGGSKYMKIILQP